MTDDDQAAVSELVADLRARLQETARRPVPARPPEKLLESLDPALGEEVVAAADELRAEYAARKAVAGSLAEQARALEKTMVADLERLLAVAGLLGCASRPQS